MARNNWLAPAQTRRVIDGDTAEFLLDTGYRQRLIQTIRVQGVDTAEIYGVEKESDEYAQGIEHKRFVEDWLDVDSDEAFPLAVVTVEEGKYGGRWVGDVLKGGEWDGVAYVNGERLSETLVAEYPEVAKEY